MPSDDNFPKDAQGVIGPKISTREVKRGDMRRVRADVYWRCECGGGAPLTERNCQLCGKQRKEKGDGIPGVQEVKEQTGEKGNP